VCDVIIMCYVGCLVCYLYGVHAPLVMRLSTAGLCPVSRLAARLPLPFVPRLIRTVCRSDLTARVRTYFAMNHPLLFSVLHCLSVIVASSISPSFSGCCVLVFFAIDVRYVRRPSSARFVFGLSVVSLCSL